MKNNVRDILSSASTTRQASLWFVRSFFAGQEMPHRCYHDGCKLAGCRRTYSYDDRSNSYTRSFLDPIHVTAESRLQQGNRSSQFWWLRVVLVVSPSMPFFTLMCLPVMVCFLVLSASLPAFSPDPLTFALDPGAFSLTESSILLPVSLDAYFRINLCPRLLDRILFPIPCVCSLLPQLLKCCC